MKQQYISQREFATIFGISTDTVGKLRERKVIKYVYMPTNNPENKYCSKIIRIPIEEVERYKKTFSQ